VAAAGVGVEVEDDGSNATGLEPAAATAAPRGPVVGTGARSACAAFNSAEVGVLLSIPPTSGFCC